MANVNPRGPTLFSDSVMTYDADGLQLTATTDPSGLNLTTTSTYDALGRTKTRIDPLNRTTTFTYDKRGNLLSTKLPDNRQHTATYDALSRRKTSTDPKNQTLTTTYWYESGQTLTLKDAKNQTTTWTYNLRGQILTKVYPNSDDHAYTYDTLGRMATHTTPKNDVCTYSYDLRDRQTLANWSTTTPDTAKTYWANGLLKSIDNGVSKSDYAYNSRNLLTSEIQTLPGLYPATVTYGYDADGLRSGVTYPSAQALDYAWTARAQLLSVSAAGPPPLATYTYDKAGRNTALVHENGITESRIYDAASQLLANTHLNGSTAVSGHGYTLDSTGRRTAETFTDGTTPTRSYGYDTADQVTSASYSSTLSDTYVYDSAGNRSTATIASLGGSTTSYTANNANQYSTISGMSAPSHDANGNLTSQNGVTYTWDSENRLLSVSDGSTTNTFTYDSQHRRVTKLTVVSGTTTANSYYVYDGWNVIEEYTQGGTGGSPVLSKTLTWGSDLSGTFQGSGGVGGLLMVEEISGSSTTAYHFQYDGNGNVTEITDLNGNPAASYRYDAFGNTLVATGSYAAANNYRFSTKPLDGEVASAPLYYYGYRFYDPITGCWPSRDPIREDGGANLYAFNLSDPINFHDYLGNIPIDVSPTVDPTSVSVISDTLTKDQIAKMGGGPGYTNLELTFWIRVDPNNKCNLTSVLHHEKWEIWIDPAKLPYKNNPAANLTGMKGHEQMHVLSIQKRWSDKVVEPIKKEKTVYGTPEEAGKAAKALDKKYTDIMNEENRKDREHTQDNSETPENETPYPLQKPKPPVKK